jgi:hypothetical protein
LLTAVPGEATFLAVRSAVVPPLNPEVCHRRDDFAPLIDPPGSNLPATMSDADWPIGRSAMPWTCSRLEHKRKKRFFDKALTRVEERLTVRHRHLDSSTASTDSRWKAAAFEAGS